MKHICVVDCQIAGRTTAKKTFWRWKECGRNAIISIYSLLLLLLLLNVPKNHHHQNHLLLNGEMKRDTVPLFIRLVLYRIFRQLLSIWRFQWTHSSSNAIPRLIHTGLPLTPSSVGLWDFNSPHLVVMCYLGMMSVEGENTWAEEG